MATLPDARPLAASREIQGNVLAPFRCDHQAFLFLGFHNQRARARQWLAAAAQRITWTADVPAARGAGRSGAPAPWMNLGLTATGLAALHPEVAADLVRFEAFWSGPLGTRIDESGRLTTTPALLGDVDASDPRFWLVGGPERPPVDALLTIAADDREMLTERVARECEKADAAGLHVVLDQRGKVLRNEQRQSVEHFGFADGISQPGIRGFSEEKRNNGRSEDAGRPGSPVIAAGEFVLGCPGERRPPARAPRPSPAPWMRHGSFQVFRRLRQDVAGWWEKMNTLSGWGSAPADVAAKAVGRRPDGRPLAPDVDRNRPNDFSYQDDAHGWHTPVYSHIRKMNPRDDAVFRDRSHQLLRRGICFGPHFDPNKPDLTERGLFFNAYMASIEDQFEFLQRRWANDPEFPARTLATFRQRTGKGNTVDGLDPVLGDDARAARRRVGNRVARDIPPLAFGGFVTTTGAVYAFAPSRTALLMLAGQASLDATAVPGR
jgi:Dyp-type peroxidase family